MPSLKVALLCVSCLAAISLREVEGTHRFQPVETVVEFNGEDRALQVMEADIRTNCTQVGTRFLCDVRMNIVDFIGNPTRVEGALNCNFDLAFIQDYRTATGCSCTARVISGSTSKTCPCSLCRSGYGRNPIAIDCDYPGRPPAASPFVIPNCSRLDCGFQCNGSCTGACTGGCSALCNVAPTPTAPAPTPTAPAPTPTAPTSPAIPPKKQVPKNLVKDGAKLFQGGFDVGRGGLSRRGVRGR